VYDGRYTRFDEFCGLAMAVAKLVEKSAGNGCFLTTASLRYVSGFACEEIPSRFLVTGLHGIPTSDLQTDHFHHTYNFWCSTAAGGRLVVDVRTVHGNELIPKDVLSVGVAIDDKFMHRKEVDAVQLDIHETIQKKKLEKLDPCGVEVLFREMRTHIKTAFLTVTTPTAHAKWQIR